MDQPECVLCGGLVEPWPGINPETGQPWGYGHNPAPLADEGRCCNECNGQVIAERLRLIVGGR